MLGHLMDAERVFAFRALSIARRDPAELAPFEEDDYVIAAEAERCAWDELLDEFQHVRKSTALFFRHLPEAAWKNQGIANGSPTSVRALAYITLGHASHHLEILKERYSVRGGH